MFLLKQRRRHRSGWSGLGLTTFQRVIGLVPRLQRQSEDEMIGPGIPHKLTFALRVLCLYADVNVCQVTDGSA